MKRLLWIVLLLLALTGSARAEELPEDLVESVPEAGEVIEEGTAFEEGISGLVQTARDSLGDILRQGTAGVVELLLLIILCGVGETMFASAGGKTGFNYMALASAAAVVSAVMEKADIQVLQLLL